MAALDHTFSIEPTYMIASPASLDKYQECLEEVKLYQEKAMRLVDAFKDSIDCDKQS